MIDVRNLKVYFPIRKNFVEEIFSRKRTFVKAVDGISFSIDEGDTLCIVGESGSGKTTTGRSILKLVPITDGEIHYNGIKISSMGEKDFRPLRRELQIIFQDPHASLSPGMTVGKAIEYGMRIHRIVDRSKLKEKTIEVLESVGLEPAEYYYNKYPATLSGGQKQRVAIARAISLNPKFIVADEPVAMLDMSVRSRILKLMIDLKKEKNLTYLFITHDLATAKFICNKILIMYLGKIVESGPSGEIFSNPKHPYTIALMNAIPDMKLVKREKEIPKGEIPNPLNIPNGCRFHTRCKFAMDICSKEEPKLKEVSPGHMVACFLY
ncbi:MAG: ABC transporter ATP-binding protein [Thermoplasmata archaeon]